MPNPSRKEFLTGLILTAAGATAGPLVNFQQGDELKVDDLRKIEKLAGFSLSDSERAKLLADVKTAQKGFAAIRKLPIDYTTEPSTVFTPMHGGSVNNAKINVTTPSTKLSRKSLSDEDIAFLPVWQLAHLTQTKQISPVELTNIYLARLKNYGPKLLALVTLTEAEGMRQARDAEREINEGHYRGPLHGIPFGIKDLFATKGIPTTWGAEPYKNQVPDFDATVVKRLHDAGAVMIAKLSMGALAMGDVWFGGMTKNPYNPNEGSSGSSAGSASATAAGLVGFAIGTETLGSIISPTIRCHTVGLRPTYGRTSRYGGMALSYTMDKVGPICRSAADTALVLAAICGEDANDPSAVSRDLKFPAGQLNKMKIGYLFEPGKVDKSSMDKDEAVIILRKLGATVEPITFGPVAEGILEILDVESSSAFDEFTRSERIELLKNSDWPQIFRAARYVPAVEYLQAQRARTLLMKQFEKEFGDFDMFLAVDHGYTLIHTNLTGHPQISMPWMIGETEEKSSARTLTGRLYQEGPLVTVAHALQSQHPTQRPDLSKFS